MIRPNSKSRKKFLVRQLGIPSILVLLAIFGTLLISTAVSFGRGQNEAKISTRRDAEGLAAHLSIFLSDVRDHLRLISRNAGPAPFSQELSPSFLQDVMKNNVSILELVFFDSEGQERLRLTQPTIGRVTERLPAAAGREFFTKALSGREFLGEPFLSDFGIPFVFWSFPVQNPEGEAIGALRATIDISTLWGNIAEFSSRNKGEAYIVDKRGLLLVRNDLSNIGNQQYLIDLEIVQAFITKSKSLLKYAGLDGAAVYGYWENIPPTDWALVIEIPVSLAISDAYRNLAVFLLLILFVFCLLAYEFFLFRQKFIKPFSALRQAVEKLGKGQFATRVSIKSGNELDDLAQVFNQMAKNIEDNTNVIVDKMKKIMQEQDKAAKMLVRRDLELSQANERLRELDKIKSEFISVAAHQLRTPLSAVKWVIKLLLDGDAGVVAREQREMMVKAYENNERMITLVNDMLNLDRLESGRYKYNFRAVRLSDILDNVLLNFTEQLLKKKIKLERGKEEARLPAVLVDPDKIGEVLKNLLDNAIKYTLPGGVIKIILKIRDNAVELEISDSGIGILAEQQNQIFTRFYRGSNATRLVTDGSGLGLAIAKDIVEKHGGRIWFESEENKGTTFHLTLPKAN